MAGGTTIVDRLNKLSGKDATTIAKALENLEEGGGIGGFEIHICASGEYDAETKVPTIEEPDSSTLYLVPTSEESGDLFDEFIWTGEAWERFGAGSVNVPKNIMDGSTAGSVRTIYSAQEDSKYKLGANAFAEGTNTKASGSNSHAEGGVTTASGVNSHAEGASTTASGNSSHAEGYRCHSANTASHAEGSSTVAAGNSSHAEGSGSQTTDTGHAAHAEGSTTIASAHAAHAEGDTTKASASMAHAEGYKTTASGQQSHAEGNTTTASGLNSHAEGYNTTASGDSSHAEGISTVANSMNQHVFGRYNIEDTPDTTYGTGTYIEIVGNGHAKTGSETEDTRSNARTLDWSGNEQLAGSLTLGMGTADEVTVTAAQLKALIALLNA